MSSEQVVPGHALRLAGLRAQWGARLLAPVDPQNTIQARLDPGPRSTRRRPHAEYRTAAEKVSHLQRQMIQALTEESLHIGSVKGYKSAWNILTTFAESVGMTATVILTDTKPLDANLIELWITDMRDTGTGAGVIASRLSAIKWCCEVNRKPLNLEATTVSRLMGAVMRSNSTVPNKAKPVTPANMRSFYDLCNTATPLVWHHRLMAIMLLCYTGFLRIGECITIQVNHLAFTPSHLTIFCPQRKGVLSTNVRLAPGLIYLSS